MRGSIASSSTSAGIDCGRVVVGRWWIGLLVGTSALGGTAADPAVSVGAADAVERAMRALDPDHIAVVVLRFEADLTVGAIAQRLGIPEGTVKSRLHIAMLRMRDAMTEDEGPR